MSKENIIQAWNIQADEFNQWDELDADEKVDFVIKQLSCDHISCNTEKDVLVSIQEAEVFLPLNGVRAILFKAAKEIQLLRTDKLNNTLHCDYGLGIKPDEVQNPNPVTSLLKLREVQDTVSTYNKNVEIHHSIEEKSDNNTLEEKLIFNGPVTVLIKPDGTKIMVRCSPNDNYNPSYGYLLCKFIESSGVERSQLIKHLAHIEALAEQQQVSKIQSTIKKVIKKVLKRKK